ncbi:hypothetical protein Hanom_Chr12g01128251 [Helianthus anomalus]
MMMRKLNQPIPLSFVPIKTTPFSSFPSKSTTPLPVVTLPSIISLATQYPLEAQTIKGEIVSFFTIEDASRRSFLSLYAYKQPRNLDDYLKVKGKQAEYIAKENNKGMDNRKFQGLLSYELSKVRKLEDYAKDLSKSMSEKEISAELDMELRGDYIEHIMRYESYKTTIAQFKDRSSDALKEEFERITKMLNDPSVKHTPPDWKKGKQVNLDKALKLKRMRAELVTASYGIARSIARWSELKIVETYKKLEELRAKDPLVPQKPAYPPNSCHPSTYPNFQKATISICFINGCLKTSKKEKAD